MKSRIIKLIRDNIFIDIDKTIVQAVIKGQLRYTNTNLAPGDIVDYSISENTYVVNSVEERKNFLIRPKVANVDIVVIIQSTVSPNFDTLLLDKMISFYEQFNCDIFIAISKADVLMNDDIKQSMIAYEQSGYKTFDINDQKQYQSMLNLFSNKLVCFVGNSGVGKSTLINRITPDLDLKTQETSRALNRGKHTTTHTCIFNVRDFYLVDTPGYSTINFNYSKLDFAHLFFRRILDNKYCKFHDCLHKTNSQHCLIKMLLESNDLIKWRYDNYLKLLEGTKWDD